MGGMRQSRLRARHSSPMRLSISGRHGVGRDQYQSAPRTASAADPAAARARFEPPRIPASVPALAPRANLLGTGRTSGNAASGCALVHPSLESPESRHLRAPDAHRHRRCRGGRSSYCSGRHHRRQLAGLRSKSEIAARCRVQAARGVLREDGHSLAPRIPCAPSNAAAVRCRWYAGIDAKKARSWTSMAVPQPADPPCRWRMPPAPIHGADELRQGKYRAHILSARHSGTANRTPSPAPPAPAHAAGLNLRVKIVLGARGSPPGGGAWRSAPHGSARRRPAPGRAFRPDILAGRPMPAAVECFQRREKARHAGLHSMAGESRHS